MRIYAAAALILILGCLPKEKKVPPPPVDEGRVEGDEGRITQRLHDGLDLEDPLLRDGKTAMVKPATFHVRGKDDWGKEFQGYLVVEAAPEAFMRVGYFEWSSDACAGRHYFDGTFDEATRMVRWTGFKVDRQDGIPVCAHYTAILSGDGNRLDNGEWSGGIGIPGRWVAEKAGE